MLKTVENAVELFSIEKKLAKRLVFIVYDYQFHAVILGDIMPYWICSRALLTNARVVVMLRKYAKS